jgi:hypothetical protein
MKASKARLECYRLLGRLIGHKAIPQFLKTQQPALEDRTGAQLLETDPASLLMRLQALKKEMEELP